MALRPLFPLVLVSALSFFPSHARGDGSAGQSATPAAAQSVKSSQLKDGKEDPVNLKEQQEKEYWCKRSAYYKKRIEKAQYEVDKEDELLSELKDTDATKTVEDKKYIDDKIKKTQNKLAGAQKFLKDREKDLARLEDEARRKKIPSEWLQCQPVWK
jgi:hypothetical protein